MPTGQEIREELEKWGICLLLGTATANNTNEGQITDTIRLQSTALPSTAYDNCYVRITSENDGVSAEDGSQSLVDYLDTTNGILYCSPNFGAGSSNGFIDSGITYEIWRHGVDPNDVDRARDEALTKLCSQWALQPLSEVRNAHYEDYTGSDPPTGWTDQTTGGSVARQTLSFPQTFIRHSLLVTNGAANDYAESTSLYCQPDQQFYLYIPVSARTGTAQIIVRDVTNGANISLSGTDTSVGRGWSGVEVTGTIPSGCYEIHLRLTGQGASDVIDWGPVFFHWEGQRRIAVPDRITTTKHVGPVYRLSNIAVSGSGTRWGEEVKQEVVGMRKEQVADSVQLRLPQAMGNNFPYVFSERKFYAALSAGYQTNDQRATGDAASTECDLDYVTAATAKLLAEQYITEQPGEQDFWAKIMTRAMNELDRKEREFGPEPQPHQERTRTIRVPYLKV